MPIVGGKVVTMDFAEGHVYTLHADCPVCQHPRRIELDTILLGWLRQPIGGFQIMAPSSLVGHYEGLTSRDIVHHSRFHVDPAAPGR